MQIMLVVWFAVVFVAGAVAGWLIAHRWFASERSMAQGRFVARESELLAQVNALKESARQRTEDVQALKDAFAALAADALHKNNSVFVELAKEKLGEQQKDATTELEMRKQAVEDLLQPVKASLEKLGVETSALELKRENAYATVLTEIGNIKQTHEMLRGETNQLVSALRDSGTRGAWGGLQLKRCIEFAGMVQYCSFELEKYVQNESGESQRPDCVVMLPNNRTIVIDAKTPMDAFLQAIDASDPEERKRQLFRHAAQVRAHLDVLETKAYWKQFPNSPDFVICFLPRRPCSVRPWRQTRRLSNMAREKSSCRLRRR